MPALRDILSFPVKSAFTPRLRIASTIRPAYSQVTGQSRRTPCVVICMTVPGSQSGVFPSMLPNSFISGNPRNWIALWHVYKLFPIPFPISVCRFSLSLYVDFHTVSVQKHPWIALQIPSGLSSQLFQVICYTVGKECCVKIDTEGMSVYGLPLGILVCIRHIIFPHHRL